MFPIGCVAAPTVVINPNAIFKKVRLVPAAESREVPGMLLSPAAIAKLGIGAVRHRLGKPSIGI
jgi:hypothetical protein